MTIVELNLLDYCSYHCKYCVARARQAHKSNDFGAYQHNGSILDMEQTLMWLAASFPTEGTKVLLTGGEPTLLPMGYEWTSRLVAMGYDVYVLTNGARMPYEAAKWSKQAKYLLTHHLEQVDFAEFDLAVKAMIAAGHKNITMQAVITPKMLEDGWASPENEGKPDFKGHFFELKEQLGQYGFPVMLTGASKIMHKNQYYVFHDERYWFFENKPELATQDLIIWSVRPQGSVHICHSHKPLSNIYVPLDKRLGNNFRCFDKDTGFTHCSTENTILTMRKYYGNKQQG